MGLILLEIPSSLLPRPRCCRWKHEFPEASILVADSVNRETSRTIAAGFAPFQYCAKGNKGLSGKFGQILTTAAIRFSHQPLCPARIFAGPFSIL
jgi:hypothetical protein